MRTKWMIIFCCWITGKYAFSNPVIPAPKMVITDRFIVDWKSSMTIFKLDYSPILERHPVTSRAILLAKKLPVNLNSDPASVLIRLKLKGQNIPFDREMQQIIPDSLQDKKEAYVLSIMKNEIFIYGLDQAGLLYGVQSLRQIMSDFKSGQPIRIQTIVDYPTFAFRGVMDDISRGPLSNLEFLKEQIERFALLKINVVSYYIEHVLKTEKHFAYAPLDALTIAELQEISEFADSFNIKIMGSFQSLGHFKNILSHPKYKDLGTSERMLKPAEASSLEFLFDNYDELFPVSTESIFNINCDEAYDLNRGPALSDLEAQIGIGNIYYNHINPLLQHVQKNGKTPGLWGDMLLKHPEVIDKLPDGTTVFTWNYQDRENFDDFILPFSTRGVPFIVTPGVVNSYRVWPDLKEAQNNIGRFSYEGWKNGAKGVLTTVWDDGGRHFFACDWYSIAVGAEHSWNPEQIKKADFSDRYYKILYQGRSNVFSRFLENLASFQKSPRLANLDNSLIELKLNIQESDGFIDTSDFSLLLNLCDRTQQSIYDIAREISAEALFLPSDFNFWLFKIRELKESILAARAICEINRWRTNINLSDQQISEDIGIEAKNRITNSQELSDQFSILWYKENRDYSFNHFNEIYNHRIAFWNDISNLAKSGQISSIPIYKATRDSYFTYWLSAGPFPIQNKQNINTDYFKSIGGEKKIRPAAVDFYPAGQGTFESWKKIISSQPDYVNLNDFFPDPNLKVLYASCQLYCESDLTISYEIRFDGKYKILLNGEFIENQIADQPGISDGELYLTKGRNDLMIKLLTTASGDNRFLFFLPGQEINSAKYRYYLHDPEQ